MKIVIDINLSPAWVAAFEAKNIEAFHWSTVGDPRAADTEIMEYARTNDALVFTHDLDFVTLLVFNTGSETKRYSGSRSRHFACASGKHRNHRSA